jgi:putative addiction module antidote
MKLKLTAIGNSTGVILPREMLDRLKVTKGDALYVHETPAGYEISPYDPEFEEFMDAAKEVMRENRDALRRLAGQPDVELGG